jgi:hypothetical protein
MTMVMGIVIMHTIAITISRFVAHGDCCGGLMAVVSEGFDDKISVGLDVTESVLIGVLVGGKVVKVKGLNDTTTVLLQSPSTPLKLK